MITYIHLVPRSKNAWSYTSSPPIPLPDVVLSLKKSTGKILPLYLPYFYIGLYGCETWSITIREEHALRVLEENIWIREKVAGGWRRLRCKEFYTMKASGNIIRVIISRRMGWAGHAARTER
jgi:hypothetical protein